MDDLLRYERAAWEAGFPIVCGVDEAGRGPLAGDVYAAAVILHPDRPIEGVNDSKKLSEKKREALFPIICAQSLAWGVGTASVDEIDAYNILQATFLAMQRAVAQLRPTPSLVLVDGNRLPDFGEIPAEALIGGDGKSASIAAASILAKVSRDRYMRALAEQHPAYQLEKHKGYGTKLHYELLQEHGVSPIHRISFLKNLDRK